MELNWDNVTWSEITQDVDKIRDALTDEESRVLFDARIDFMVTGDRSRYFEVIESLPHKWKCRQLEPFLDNNTEIIIFGCGHDGKLTNRILKKCGLSAKCFCDSNQFGLTVDGLKVISIDELLENHVENTVVVLGSSRYQDEMFEELKRRGYPENRILNPTYKILGASIGKQYFDIFPADHDEVFVDAGAYNGSTTLDFVSWAGGNYWKVFILEPLPEMCGIIEDKIHNAGLQNVEIQSCAAWDKEEELFFAESGSGSKVAELGGVMVKGMAIDDIVAQEDVTYIKMDIEGSELKALIGAAKTILRCKPKLAICIYHKPGDVLVLASYILRLVPEYKLSIRHYYSNMWETVLYAKV